MSALLRRLVSLYLPLLFTAGIALSAQQVQYSSAHRDGERQLPQTVSSKSKALQSTLAAGRTGIALAVADFDEDGTPDLLTGYATGTGGALLLQRGAAGATAPTQAEWSMLAAGEMVTPFIARSEAIALSFRPDLLVAADVHGHGHTGLIAATKGSTSVYVLRGDGTGGFSTPRALPIAGPISALATWSAGNGDTLIVAAVCGGTSCGLQFLKADGTTQGFVATPAPVTAIQGASLNGGSLADLALIAGGRVLVLDGGSAFKNQPRLDTLPVQGAAALTSGDFVYDRRGLKQLAVLDANATLHILARTGVDNTAATPEEVRAYRRHLATPAKLQLAAQTAAKPITLAWTEVETLTSIGPGSGNTSAPLLLRGRLTASGGGDDLAVLAGGQYLTIAHPTAAEGVLRRTTPIVMVDATHAPVTAAVLARISADARLGVITVDSTELPKVAIPPVRHTFMVNTTADGLASNLSGLCTGSASTCTLRDAVALANKDSAANGQSGIDTIMLPAGTYTFTSAYHPPNDSQGSVAYHYDLDASINIVGAGAAATILNGNNLDKIFSADSGVVNGYAPFDIFLSGLTLENGFNPNNPDVAANSNYYGGLMDWESFGPGNLTFSAVVMTSGECPYAQGGGLLGTNSNGADSTATEGVTEFDNSTITNNKTPNSGGGMWLGAGIPLVLNNTSITGNKALPSVDPPASNTAFEPGQGGGVYAQGSGAGTTSKITGSTISGNTAYDEGGGLNIYGPLTMTSTTVTGNTGGSYGGGLYLNNFESSATITTSTFTGNTLTNTGASYNLGSFPSDGAGVCTAAGTSSEANEFHTTLHYNRLHANTGGHSTGLGVGCDEPASGGSGQAIVAATDNWWGCNGAATGTGCDTAATPAGAFGETLTLTPYTTLTLTLSTTTPVRNATFTATGSLGQDSIGTSYGAANDLAYSGLPATLSIVQNGGGTTNATATTLSTTATIAATATAAAIGAGTAQVTVDGTTVTTAFNVPGPDLIVTSSHVGNFFATDASDTYTLIATNSGGAATSGTVTVSDTVPSIFLVTAAAGSGWSCFISATAPSTCTRSDALAAGAAYPAITLTVRNRGTINNEQFGTVSNMVTISGGSETNTANDSFSDSTLVIGGPAATLAFTPSTIPLSGSSVMSYTITNPNSTITLTGIGFTQTLPSNLKIATPTGFTGSCGGGTITAAAGGSSLSLGGATLAPGAVCSFSVRVVPLSAGTAVTSTGNISSTNGGLGPGGSAQLTIVAPLSLSGSFGASSIAFGGTTSLTFTIINPNASTAQTSVSMTDTLPAGLVVATPNELSGSCGTGTLTASPGSSTITLTAGTVAAGGTCTFAVNVTGTTPGMKTNIETVSSTEGGTSAAATQTLTVNAPTTTTAILVTPASPVNAGTLVTITATVTATSGGTGVHPGMVNFYDTSTGALIGTAELNSHGQATLKFVPGAGTHVLEAQFQGTVAFPGKTSAQQTLVVSPAGTYRTTSVLKEATSGSTATLTDTVTFYGQVTPNGNVQFTSSGTAIATRSATPVTQTLAAPANAPSGAASTGTLFSVVGDFNQDGLPDLAVTNLADDTISILLGNGDGTFKPPVSYPAGSGPYAIAVSDFNADGYQDLVVTNLFDNTISVYLGKGDGTFAAKTTFATGTEPFSVTVADLNHDGIADVVVTNQGDKTVGVLLGRGDGTFQAQTLTTAGTDPAFTVAADFNGDGNIDLVVLNGGDSTVGLLLGKGDGTFQPQALTIVGSTPYSATVGDFNGDGLPDLAVVNLGDNTIGVLLNNGAGGFAPQVIYATGVEPTSVAALNFDGTGRQSLAVANNGGNTVSILVSKGDGTFQPQVAFPSTSVAPYQLAVADFNGDGKPDLAVTTFGSNVVGVQLGTQTAVVTLGGLTPVTGPFSATYAGNSGDAYRTSTSNTTTGASALHPTVPVAR